MKNPCINQKTRIPFVITIIAIFCTLLLSYSSAASMVFSLESETGNKTNDISIILDEGASGGKAIQFVDKTKGKRSNAYINLAVYPEYHGKNPDSNTQPDRSEPYAPTNIAWHELDRVEAWLGREVKYVMQFGNPFPGSWSNLENNMYTISSNLKDMPIGNRIPIVSIPLTVNQTKLQDVINGSYDNHFRNIATSYKNNGLGNTIWRLGWENNTSTWDWSSKEKSYETNRATKYAQAWSRIRNVMYSVSNDFKFSYDFEYYALTSGTGPNGWAAFSGTSNGILAYKAYPTGSQPDYIGVDMYDAIHSSQGGYNRYGGKTWEENQQLIWDNHYSKALEAASAFAKSKNKPLVIPEWAIGRGDHYSIPQNNVGGDNHYFMKKMLDFIDDPNNNIAWHSYFNRYDKTTEGTFKINPLYSGLGILDKSWAPNASAEFRSRVGN